MSQIDSRNFYGPKSKSQIVTQEMAFYCIDVLQSTLRQTIPSMTIELPLGKYPLFVTWTQKAQDELRGCAGSFEPVGILEGLNEYAVTSAMKDPRFPPITADEINDLQVTVAILSDFEEAKHYLDWTIGVHGLQLNYEGRNGEKRSANFLPEYPLQTGWTRIETFDMLMRKTGFIGKITAEDRQAVKISRFQTHKITRSYDEFNQFRNWKTKNSQSLKPPPIRTSD